MGRITVPALAGLSYLGSGLNEKNWSPANPSLTDFYRLLQRRASLELDWRHVHHPVISADLLSSQAQYLHGLCQSCCELLQEGQPFLVLGGDHSNAMAVWRAALTKAGAGRFGLLWIDAHMDSHTFITTPTVRVHGMPLAALLGEGDAALQAFYPGPPYLDPQKLFVVGVASYEPEERALLQRLQVNVVEREATFQRGTAKVIGECLDRLNRECDSYGISIDLDGLNVDEAPAVGTPVPGGLAVADVCRGLGDNVRANKLLALEIAEYYPSRDKQSRTQRAIAELLAAVFDVA